MLDTHRVGLHVKYDIELLWVVRNKTVCEFDLDRVERDMILFAFT